MKITQTSNFERVHIPARIYDAIVTQITETQIKDFDDPTKMKPMFRWVFEIVGKEKTITLEGLTSVSFNPKSKFYEWAKAVLLTEPPIELETDDLLHKPCKVQVEDRERDGSKYSAVKTVLPGEAEELPF